jgi:hypothetical protein
MTTIRPATLHHAEDPRLAEVAAALTGEAVTGARYLVPAGVGLHAIDDVDLGAELVFGSGQVLVLEWATPGIEEGLAIAVRDTSVDESLDLVDRIDVTDDPHWSGIIGNRVETLAVAFFHPDEDSPARPWSFRVGVTGGSSVTVALGEPDGSGIRYQPDNLVVIFDEAAARAYRIVGAIEPAWGSQLAHWIH